MFEQQGTAGKVEHLTLSFNVPRSVSLISFFLFYFVSLSGSNYLSTIDTDELYQFISRYKFIISYENGVCNDYVTEKLWRTLIVGSVPVYFGAPNIKVSLTVVS